MKIEDQLKTCAHCGGNPNTFTRTITDDSEALVVECQSCMSEMESGMFSRYKTNDPNRQKNINNLVEEWNKRVDQEPATERLLTSYFENGVVEGFNMVANFVESLACDSFKKGEDDNAIALRELVGIIKKEAVKKELTFVQHKEGVSHEK